MRHATSQKADGPCPQQELQMSDDITGQDKAEKAQGRRRPLGLCWKLDKVEGTQEWWGMTKIVL